MPGSKVPIGGDKQVTTADIPQILATIRHFESGNNYTARSKSSSASGAYQIIDSTWSSWKKAVPAAIQYAHAADAPPSVQDAVAAAAVTGYIQQFGGWLSAIPFHWYYPPAWNNPDVASKVPPGGGNTMSVQSYAQRWVNWFNTGTNSQPVIGSGPGTGVKVPAGGDGTPADPGYTSTTIPGPADTMWHGMLYMVDGKYIVQKLTGLYYYIDPEGLIYTIVGNKRNPVEVPPGQESWNLPFGIGSVVDFLRLLANPDTWIRVAKVLGGIVALIVGLVMLGKQMGITLPNPTTVAALAAA